MPEINGAKTSEIKIRENSEYSLNERLRIIWRCVLNRCPNCAKGGISKPWAFPSECPQCHFIYDRGNGFLLTALPAVYFGFALFWVVPMMVLVINDILSFNTGMTLVGIGAVAIPALLFNYCKMLALALYYFFLPRELDNPDLQDNF